MAIRSKMKVIMPGDLGFEESLESRKCIYGADIQAPWHAWNAGEIPDPTNGDCLRLLRGGARPAIGCFQRHRTLSQITNRDFEA